VTTLLRGGSVIRVVAMCAFLGGSAAQAQGVFTHQIQIKLPKGANGVQPELALVYAPTPASGMVGAGWQLTGLSEIALVQYGPTDAYAHSQAGILERQSDGSYRSKSESFTRLVPAGTCGTGPCSWTATDRSGVNLFYGATADSRLLRSGSTSARVWALSKVQDLFGNWYEVSYDNDTTDGNLYPATITYTRGAGITTYRTVEFAYETRSDVESGYPYPGSLEKTSRRLLRVTVKSGGMRLREYRLEYECGGSPCPGSQTARSRLRSVTEVGSDGLVALPPQTFEWQQGGSGYEDAIDVPASFTVRSNGISRDDGVRVADLNGDGLPDLIQGIKDRDGSKRRDAWINTGHGWERASRYAPPEVAVFTGANGLSVSVRTYDAGVRLVDLNGDGRPDLMQGFTDGTTTYRNAWLNDSDKTSCQTTGCVWTPAPQFVPPVAFTARDSGTPTGWDRGVRIADLNADSRPDLIQGFYGHGTVVQLAWLNTGNGWSAATGYAPPSNFSGRDDKAYGGFDWGLRLADVNGDGRPDLLLARHTFGNEVRDAWINTGTGWSRSSAFAPPLGNGSPQDPTFVPSASFAGRNDLAPGGWDAGTRIADLNGDGRPDLIRGYFYPGWTTQAAWLNTGTGWSLSTRYKPPANFAGRDESDPETAGGWNSGLELGDLNGDGKADLIQSFYNFGDTQTYRNVWINSGSGWAHSSTYPAPGYDPPAFFGGRDSQYPGGWDSGTRVLDIDGDGRDDLIQGLSLEGDPPYRRAWRNRGPAADLVWKIRTGLGAEIELSYAAAPQIPGVVSCDVPGIPNTAPQQLVTRVVTRDGRGGSYAARHEYHGACWLPGTITEARNLGFAWLNTVDEQTSQSTKTFFNQNPGYEGRVSSMEERDALGRLVTVKTTTYDRVFPSTGTELVRERETTAQAWEAGSLSFTQRTTTEYDEYGNATVKTQYADGLPTVTVTTTYVNDAVNWVLGRISGVKTMSGSRVLGEVRNTWNGNGITAKSEWLDTKDVWITTSMLYDDFGNLESVEEPPVAEDGLSRKTTTEYDEFRASATNVTNALGQGVPVGQATRRTYTPDGLVATSTDLNGNVTVFAYDELGRIRTETRPDGGTTRYSYVAWGDPAQQHTRVETKVDGRFLYRYEYFDGLGLKYLVLTSADCPVIAGFPAGLAAVETQKDAAGRAYRTSQRFCYGTAEPTFTTTLYDEQGRMKSVLTPDGKTSSYAYGLNWTSITDANGKVTKRYFDARKQVTSIVDAANQTTSYGYDPLGRLTSATLPDTTTTTVTYDSLNRKASVTEPTLGTTSYVYDDAGNVRTITAGGKSMTFEYDALNRVTFKTPQGETMVAFTYDEPEYANGIGRLTTVIDDTGTRHFSYTVTGGINATTQVADGASYTQGFVYDLGGRVTRTTYPNGSHADYAYTDGGNLSTLSLDGAAVATWSVYDASGQPGSVVLGNGVVTTYAYDTLGHIKNILTKTGTTELQNLEYDWYSLPETGGMHIGSITDRRANRMTPGCNPDGTACNTDETQTYSYDALYRLTRATGIWGTKTYAYDSIGNVKAFGGVVNRSLTYGKVPGTSIDSQQVVSGTGLNGVTFDAAGNMTAKTLDGTSWEYGWTAEGRLTSVKKNGALTAQMTYDADGQRVKKVYTPAGGTAVTTTYFGNVYEKRTYGDGTPERHTLHVYGNGYLVASVTRTGPITTASNGINAWRSQLAAASMYEGGNVVGAAKKAWHVLSAGAAHPKAARLVTLGAFGLFALLVLAIGARSWALGFSRRLRAPLRLASGSLVLLFAFTACSGGGPGNASYRGIAGREVLTGDTTRGPAPGTFYYHRNHINSSSVVTDGSGAERTRIVYLPFGEIWQPASAGLDTVTSKYTGKELDEETGLYYYGARYYDPAIGRFASPDPIVPSVSDAQSFNRYSYVRNNPIVYTDPTGHFWEFIGKIFNAIGDAFRAIGDAIASAARWLGAQFAKVGRFIASAASNAWQLLKAMGTNPFAIAGFVFAVALSIVAHNPGPLLLWAKATAAAIGVQAIAMAAGVKNPIVLSAIGAVAGIAASGTQLLELLRGAARWGINQGIDRIDNKWVRLAISGALFVTAIVLNRLTMAQEEKQVRDPGQDPGSKPEGRAGPIELARQGRIVLADNAPVQGDTMTDAMSVDQQLAQTTGEFQRLGNEMMATAAAGYPLTWAVPEMEFGLGGLASLGAFTYFCASPLATLSLTATWNPYAEPVTYGY
jgi:RHS repeat-associated protein